MKRLIIALLLWLLATTPALADCPDAQYCYYIPLVPVFNPCVEGGGMSDWKIVIPESTTNKVLNPSGETTGNFAAEAGTGVSRVTTFQHYGVYSIRVESNANNEGIQFTLSALANAIHYATVRVRGTLPAAWDWSLDGSTFTAPTLLEDIDGDWKLYGLEFPAAQASGSTLLEIHQNGTGSGDYYLDGIQVEQKEYWTTYCDGSQPGCEWNGPADASTSQRSAASRAGGRLYDLQDDYNLKIGGMSGTGTPPQSLGVDSYATLPGGELNSLKINSRVFTLTGVITGTTQADFHDKKQTLLEALSPDAYPEDENGPQPVRLRYHGATVHKEISVHYDGGLEGELSASDPCFWERVAVRFLAPNPYWAEIGESAAALDTNDSATFRNVAGRLRSTGQWDDLGPPNSAGTYNGVLCFAEDATYLYIGGNFLNFDNIAAADYIVRYNKQTGAYSALGSGLNNLVVALAIAPNGDLYIGGNFTNAGGVAAADYLTRWDGSNYNAVGTPVTGAASISGVEALVFDHSGNLYIGGAFDNWNDIANADNIVMWSGSAYSALSTGVDDVVHALAVMPDNDIIIGGEYTSPALRIARWDGSSFSALGGGIGNGGTEAVHSLLVAPNGDLYIGGAFSSPPGNITLWNGAAYVNLGDGLDFPAARALAYANGQLYAGGDFTAAGGIDIADGMARWNGYAWAHIDVDLPGTQQVYAILASKYVDPVLDHKYDLFVGFIDTGTGNYAGLTTETNDGTAPAFPKIIIGRSGGTTAIIETVKNESTGKELLLNYSLQSGESLTIDLTPTKKSITSSFYGPRPDAILANSDFGKFSLLPGSNSISCFVATSGSPTVVGYLQWKAQYKSQD